MNTTKNKLVYCAPALDVSDPDGIRAERLRSLAQSCFDLRVIDTVTEGDFDTLVKNFRHADMVMYEGGFDLLVCEVARISRVPVLIETINQMAPGQLFDNIDLTICASEAVRNVQPTPEQNVVVVQSSHEYQQILNDLLAQKGHRAELGPEKASPTPESITGEAMRYFTRDEWPNVADAVERLLAHTKPITNLPCAGAIMGLALQAVHDKEVGIADTIYRKLYRSGFRDEPLLTSWISLPPPKGVTSDPEIFDAMGETISLAPEDESLLMLVVQSQLAWRDIAGAITTLEQGMARLPGSETLREAHKLLKARLE